MKIGLYNPIPNFTLEKLASLAMNRLELKERTRRWAMNSKRPKKL